MAELAGKTSPDIDLDYLALDGVIGDTRANLLDASGHSRSIQISGGAANHTLKGGDNNDQLSGDAGTDKLYGNGGNDLLFVDAKDLAGGNVYGGDDIDTLIVADAAGVTVDLLGRQVEIVVGGDGNDTLNGGDVEDDLRLYGEGGGDTLRGANGDDILSGDGGNDTLRGYSGDDYLAGDTGTDTLDGGDGDDLLMGGRSDDYLQGAAGDDRLLGGDHNDTMFGSTGDDHLQGEGGNDTLEGGEGDDVLSGGVSNDRLVYWRGDDTLRGESGDDTFVMDNEGYGTAKHFGWAIFQGGTGYDSAELWGTQSEWTVKDLGDGQWQFYREVSGTEKVVIDLQDIEKVKFGGDGSTRNLNTDTSKDRSDNYERRSYNPYVGDSEAMAGEAAYTSGGFLKGWMGDDQLTGKHGFVRQGDRDTGYTYVVSDVVSVDAIDGGSGQDDIDGYGGDDTLIGGSGFDMINGGAGNDTTRAIAENG